MGNKNTHTPQYTNHKQNQGLYTSKIYESLADVDNYSLDAIQDNGDWSLLQKLNLECYQIDDQKLKSMTSKDWPNLTQLNLFGNNITAIGISQLIPKKWPKLKQLKLTGNNIGSKGAKLLIKVNLPLLEDICIRSCNLGTEGANHIAKGKWKNLRSLSIYYNNMGLDAYIAINGGNWEKIQSLITGQINQRQEFYQIPINVLACFSCPFRHISTSRSIQNLQINRNIQIIYNKRIKF